MKNTDIEDLPSAVKIYTFRRFEIVKGGKPIVFAGKVQKKPLLLLKALIVHGGVMREELACDLLWPETEGDPRKALGMAVIRLRNLIGYKEAVTYSGATITLNTGRLWVDAWAFADLIKRAEAAQKSGQSAEILEKAAALYTGDFLPGEREPWIIDYRKRLRSQAEKVLGNLAKED